MKLLKGDQKELIKEIEELRLQLQEANEMIHAIRTGQIDALMVSTETGPQLYTLKSADHTYRIFIEKMKEGAVTLNQDEIILYSNSQFAAMVDLPLSEVIGVPFRTTDAARSRSKFRNSGVVVTVILGNDTVTVPLEIVAGTFVGVVPLITTTSAPVTVMVAPL